MILPATNLVAAHKPLVFTRDPGKRGCTVVVKTPDEPVARSFRAVDQYDATTAKALIADAYQRGVQDGRAAGPSARPWEGPEGHLFLRDLVQLLHAEGAEPRHVLYALGKPWKFITEVSAFRAAIATGKSIEGAAQLAEEAASRG